jgi:hypothetical protein
MGDPFCAAIILPNVQELATPLAGASVETGVKVHVTGDVFDRAASGVAQLRLVLSLVYSDCLEAISTINAL